MEILSGPWSAGRLAAAWFDAFAPAGPPPPTVAVDTLANGWSAVRFGRGYEGGLTLAGRPYDWGLGTHARSEVLLRLPGPGARLHADVGVDYNRGTAPEGRPPRPNRIVFRVEPKGGAAAASPALHVMDPPFRFDVDLGGAASVTLRAESADGHFNFSHADWAGLTITLADGTVIPVGWPSVPRAVPVAPPCAFRYGGKPVDLSAWERRDAVETRAGGLRRVVEWTDPGTGLACRAEATKWSDGDALEWVLWFENKGRADTPLLEDVWPLDAVWGHYAPAVLDRMPGERLREVRNGYPDGRGDFEMETLRLDAADAGTVRMNPGEGRSSNQWMPYFNLREPGRGVIAAVGWTGLWGASFAPESDGVTRMRIGLDRTRLYLRPGERIRTPRVLMQFWDGDAIDGHNAFRRTMRAHYSPRGADGAVVTPPVCEGAWGGMETSIHLGNIRRLAEHRLDYDYYWIDAGWFGVGAKNIPELDGSPWWRQVGDWTVNPEIYPNGMKEVADAAHAAGYRFLLWCEPERAMAHAPAVTRRPHLFLRSPGGGDSLLLNLAAPEGLAYLTDLVDGLVRDNGVDCYRQDFNTDPLPYWRAADADNRVGFTESKYIEHLYAFLDELRRRHPDLLVDNCASGGRRLDFEMAGRGVPLWRSDLQCFPGFDLSEAQTQLHGLSYWLPIHGTGAHSPAGDNYQLRSNYGTNLSMGSGGADFPYAWQRGALTEFKRVRPFILHGDYYPLVGGTADADRWQAAAYVRPERHEAMVLAFRREESPFTGGAFRLRGLDADRTYTVENVDTDEARTWTGRALMETGLSIDLPRPRTSALFFLREANPSRI